MARSVSVPSGAMRDKFALPPDDGFLALDTQERRDQEKYFGEGQEPEQDDKNG